MLFPLLPIAYSATMQLTYFVKYFVDTNRSIDVREMLTLQTYHNSHSQNFVTNALINIINE